ncbi:MAG TPA: hypothetical protein VGH42_03290 [Verrucomicrobiae bacterium]|jgi:hypothetical protein
MAWHLRKLARAGKLKHQPHKNYENIPSGAFRINEMNKSTVGLHPIAKEKVLELFYDQ